MATRSRWVVVASVASVGLLWLAVWRLSFINWLTETVTVGANAFWALEPAVKVSILQTGLFAVAGVWTYLLYRRRRENQATVQIGLAVRVHRPTEGQTSLFCRFHILNSSSARVRNVDATATLLDPSESAEDGSLAYRLLGQQDILAEVSGDAVQDGDILRFQRTPDNPFEMEPNECVEAELRFLIDAARSNPVALRVELLGSQSRFPLPAREYAWGSFAFLDVTESTDGHVAVSMHTEGSRDG